MVQNTAPNIRRKTPHALTNPVKSISFRGSEFVTFGGLLIAIPGYMLITEKGKQSKYQMRRQLEAVS